MTERIDEIVATEFSRFATGLGFRVHSLELGGGVESYADGELHATPGGSAIVIALDDRRYNLQVYWNGQVELFGYKKGMKMINFDNGSRKLTWDLNQPGSIESIEERIKLLYNEKQP